MNALDIAIVVLVLGGSTLGFLQGVLRQALGLLALYLAALLASQYYAVVGNALGWLFPATTAARASVAFLLVFVWAVLFLAWLTRRVYPAARILSIGIFDNILGAVLGLGTGAIVVCLSATGLRFAIGVPWPTYDHVRVGLEGLAQSSTLLPYVSYYAPTLYATLAPWFPGGVPAILAAYS